MEGSFFQGPFTNVVQLRNGRSPTHAVRSVAPAGFHLAELMFAVALGVTITAIAVPAVLAGLDDLRTGGAARYLAGRIQLLRMEAVKRSADVGMVFDKNGTEHAYAAYIDGNWNGVRTADVRSGVDVRLGVPERIGDKFQGVHFGIVEGVTAIDGGGALDADGDPVRLGKSDILTMTSSGTATSGTIYVRGRTRQYAVRVLGATGRTRVLEFNFGAGRWVAR